MKFEDPGGQISKSEQALAAAKLVPPQEDRNGLMVNALTAKQEKIKGELASEALEGFLEVMHGRITEELAREKTSLPKDSLQRLDEELRSNPEVAKAIIESFGYGVASDPFMLCGLIAKSKDLINHTIRFYNEIAPSVQAFSKRIEDVSDGDVLHSLKEFWDTEESGRNKGEFPRGEDIQYYAGKDVPVDDENPRFFIEKGKAVPSYRYVFGPTRKNKTDYASVLFETTEQNVKNEASRKTQNHALQFRDNSALKGRRKDDLVVGYPGEWYIPGSNKSKVLADYFSRYMLPQIRKQSGARGIGPATSMSSQNAPSQRPREIAATAKQEEIDQETLKTIVHELFFRAAAPKTLSDLSTRIETTAREHGLPADKLEREFVAYMSDELVNSVD